MRSRGDLFYYYSKSLWKIEYPKTSVLLVRSASGRSAGLNGDPAPRLHGVCRSFHAPMQGPMSPSGRTHRPSAKVYGTALPFFSRFLLQSSVCCVILRVEYDFHLPSDLKRRKGKWTLTAEVSNRTATVLSRAPLPFLRHRELCTAPPAAWLPHRRRSVMRPAGALPLCYAPAENVAAQVFPVSGGPVRLCLSRWRLPDKKEVANAEQEMFGALPGADPGQALP